MSKLIKSFGWAMNGIHSTWNEELTFRIELGIAVLAICLGAYVQITKLEWVLIAICIGSVLSSEVLNTAIEDLCNKIEPNTDPVIGKIKDMMAGLVLIVATTSAVVGLMVFSNHF